MALPTVPVLPYRMAQFEKTAAEWAADDQELYAGELAFEDQGDGTYKIKIGTGALYSATDFNIVVSSVPTAHAASHAATGADALTLAQSQITDLTDALAAKLAAASNLSDLADAATARANLGVVGTVSRAVSGATDTLVLTDVDKAIDCTSDDAQTVTIPANADVAFPVGTVILITQLGAGVVTITGDTGVTVNGVSAGSGAISAQYGAVAIRKLGTDTWHAYGANEAFS